MNQVIKVYQGFQVCQVMGNLVFQDPKVTKGMMVFLDLLEPKVTKVKQGFQG